MESAAKIGSVDNLKYEDFVLIVESVGEDLSVVNNSHNNTILEGVCAIFGQKNSNNRIYEKDEYLPHLGYLKEKIKKRQLIGDLDHPPHFDVTLKSASHIIESLEYDGGNKINIKLRILENTPNGKIAKALIDGGVNLSISSRAAGEVLNEGRVRLHRIFTYDLVGEPGFTEAILKQATNESLQSNFEMITESYNHLKEESFIKRFDLQEVSESLNYDDNFKFYKINKDIESSLFENSIQTEKNNNNKMAEHDKFVTKDSMNRYSEVVKEEFNKIRKEIKGNAALLESVTNEDGQINATEMVKFINYLAENVEGVINYAEYLSEMIDKNAHYTEHVAKTTNNAIEYTSYIGEKLNTTIGHQDYIAEKMNQTINYTEYLKENLNGSINYQNYLAEELDKGLQYTEYVAEGANNITKFAEYLSENINFNREYAGYVAEKAGQGIGYTEYIAESLNNGNIAPGKRNLLGGVERLTESATIDALVGKVDEVITEVNSDSSKAVLENRHPFLKILTEENKTKFYGLDSKVKQSIVETLGASVWFTEADVLGIMDAVINEETKNIPNLIKFMPDAYKPVWEKMNESEKNKVFAKSQLYDLKTPYQVKSFWDEFDMRPVNERIAIQAENIKTEKLNENQGTEGMISIKRINEQSRGYSNGYLNSLKRRAE